MAWCWLVSMVTVTGLTGGADRGIEVYRDIAYAEAAGVDPNLLSLDVYTARGAARRPVLVMLHGGGWRRGDKAMGSVGMEKARHFVPQGYVYVSVNYRLSPDVMHPTHVTDVAAALAYVERHIAGYGGDPARIYVMGHSAGAHLAALVTIDERYLLSAGTTPGMVKGVVLLDGAGYDIPPQMRFGGPMVQRMYGNAFSEDVEVQRDASPIHHVAPGKPIPPFLIVYVADRADARRQSTSLAEALTDAGYEARLYPAEDKTHATVNREIGQAGDPITAEIMRFLEEPAVTVP